MQMLIQDLVSTGGTEAQGHSTIEDIQASIRVALQEVERLDSIVHDLLSFAKPRQPRSIRCDLPALIDRVLHLLHTDSSDSSIIIERIYRPVPIFWADILQIEQVLLNLAHNALQAMGAGGTLTISCRVPASEEDGVPARRWVEIVVSDTGCGIAQDCLERIFQPFFTTRAHGIGLGLSITRRLIEDHGGRINVESRVGQGTTVTVWLPLLTRDPISDEE
jgi:signal transduction histidine kinase